MNSLVRFAFACYRVSASLRYRQGYRVFPIITSYLIGPQLRIVTGIKMQSRGQANGSDGHEEHGDSVKRHTRSEVKQNEKDYRDYYLQMSLEEKRKLYKCKSKFNQLKDILTWEEFYHKNKERLLKKLGKKKTTPLYTVNAEINSKVSIWRGDITTLEIDVIVNAANSSLLGGGGVDGAIHEAAGRKLVEECVTLQGCKTGDAKITGGYKLPAKYVIHTVGPIGEKEPLLKSAYQNSLKVMLEKKLRSVALPCISTGIYGYDNQKACHVALKVVREFLTTNADSVDRVIFCLFLPKDVDLYEENMQIYFPVETVETSNLDDKEMTSGDVDMEKSVQTAKSNTKSKDSSPEKENAESAKAEKSSASSEGKTSTDLKERVVDVEQKETKRREKKAKILDKERTSGDVDMEKSVQTAKSNTKSKDSSPEKENAESAKAEKSSCSSDEKANTDTKEEGVKQKETGRSGKKANTLDKEKTSGDVDMEKSVQTAKSNTKSKDSSPEKENAESAKAEKSSASSEGKTSTDSKEEGVVDVEQKETERREKKAKILDKKETGSDVEMKKLEPSTKSKIKNEDSSRGKEKAQSESDDMETSSVDKSSDDAQTSPERMDDSGNEKVGVEKIDVEQLKKDKKTKTQTSKM